MNGFVVETAHAFVDFDDDRAGARLAAHAPDMARFLLNTAIDLRETGANPELLAQIEELWRRAVG